MAAGFSRYTSIVASFQHKDVNGSSLKQALIGLTDRVQEGVFVWVDGSPLSFTKWSDNNPSDSTGSDDYMAILPPGGRFSKQWLDTKESELDAFVCERIVRPIPGVYGVGACVFVCV